MRDYSLLSSACTSLRVAHAYFFAKIHRYYTVILKIVARGVLRLSTTKLKYQYIFLQGSYYAGSTVFIPFAVFILQEQGFTNGQIGLLLGIRALVSVFFQPLFADIIVKYEHKISYNYFVALMIVASMILTVLQMFNSSFIGAIVIFILYGVFTFGLSSFLDAMSTLYFHAGKKINYPVARAAGSFSFAIGVLLIGFLTSARSLLIVQLLLFIPMLILILQIDELKGFAQADATPAAKTLSLTALIKQYPLFGFFLVAIIFSFTGKEMAANFLIDVYRSLGGSSQTYGLGMFVLAMSEIPSALIFDKLTRKLGVYNLMIFSFFFAAVRVFLILLAPNLLVLNIAQAFQLIGYGLFWAGNVQFIRTVLPPAYTVKAQAIIGVCYLGVGSGVGSVLSGFILEQTNLTSLLTVASILSAVGVLVLLVGRRYQKKIGQKLPA